VPRRIVLRHMAGPSNWDEMDATTTRLQSTADADRLIVPPEQRAYCNQ
jgi:hypothetical protein